MDDFEQIYELYASKAGATFTAFGLDPESEEYEIAYTQMLQYLNGDRLDPVTHESIGIESGEGVIDA